MTLDVSKAISGGTPLRMPTYTVATLPALTAGDAGALAFASDATNGAQTTGNGTGQVCFWDGTAWLAVEDGAAPAA